MKHSIISWICSHHFVTTTYPAPPYKYRIKHIRGSLKHARSYRSQKQATAGADFTAARDKCASVLNNAYKEYIVKLKARIAKLPRGSKQWWSLKCKLLNTKHVCLLCLLSATFIEDYLSCLRRLQRYASTNGIHFFHSGQR